MVRCSIVTHMTPLFLPRLVNGPLGDPVLFIDFRHDTRAILFDLGDIHDLSPRNILKISHIFVSHTHMDHFIGFDRFLRICLGRGKTVRLFGPVNFLDQVKSKLLAYTWNLIGRYPQSLDLIVSEIHADHIWTADLRSAKAFEMEEIEETALNDGLLYQEAAFDVRVGFVDHKIPCLAFALEERFHVNILKTELVTMGLSKGPWLRPLKEAIWRGDSDETSIRASTTDEGLARHRWFSLGEMRSRLIRITSGQKIAYVVDTIYNEEMGVIIRNLVQGSDYLFMETPFLEEDGRRALDKHHLTAKQAGLLAGAAGARRLIPFHVSPKYNANPKRVIDEALATFKEVSKNKAHQMVG
jgi:ribonuclease Z